MGRNDRFLGVGLPVDIMLPGNELLAQSWRNNRKTHIQYLGMEKRRI